eukprot:scaffold23612_cov66-Phaeocystis_antarctica.AAC.6
MPELRADGLGAEDFVWMMPEDKAHLYTASGIEGLAHTWQADPKAMLRAGGATRLAELAAEGELDRQPRAGPPGAPACIAPGPACWCRSPPPRPPVALGFRPGRLCALWRCASARQTAVAAAGAAGAAGAAVSPCQRGSVRALRRPCQRGSFRAFGRPGARPTRRQAGGAAAGGAGARGAPAQRAEVGRHGHAAQDHLAGHGRAPRRDGGGARPEAAAAGARQLPRRPRDAAGRLTER